MNVIILAAGRSNRLGSLTENMPKCLLTINDESILDRQVRILKENGISEENIYIVAGYKCELLLNRYKNVIINDIYDKTDNSYSLGLGLKTIGDNDDVLILDGDLVFDGEIINKILINKNDNMILTKKSVDLHESTGVLIDEKNQVMDISKKVVDSGLIYISIFKINRILINEFIELLISKQESLTWYTSSIVKLLKKYDFINLTVDSKWHEIDILDDYIETQLMFNEIEV